MFHASLHRRRSAIAQQGAHGDDLLGLEQRGFKCHDIAKPDPTTICNSRQLRISHAANRDASHIEKSSEGEDKFTSGADPAQQTGLLAWQSKHANL